MFQVTNDEHTQRWKTSEGYWISDRDVCHHCLEQCEAENKPARESETRLSLGIYAGRYCDECWAASGYRKEGAEGYDYLDAGEYYDDDY
jgi:hypothetical protein